MYTAIIERPDGSTFEQVYDDLEELILILGDDYWVVDIY